ADGAVDIAGGKGGSCRGGRAIQHGQEIGGRCIEQAGGHGEAGGYVDPRIVKRYATSGVVDHEPGKDRCAAAGDGVDILCACACEDRCAGATAEGDGGTGGVDGDVTGICAG